MNPQDATEVELFFFVHVIASRILGFQVPKKARPNRPRKAVMLLELPVGRPVDLCLNQVGCSMINVAGKVLI